MKILYLIKKEFLEIFRQRELLFMMLIAPVFQLIILGYIVTTDIKNVPVGIIDLSTGKSTTRIINRIAG
ncbi:MAG: ABC transporter permease, partial [Candidatus Aminicenantes bacterium]|nr:ABC transporter permease [Candidatus Aminicenantes bacterium]